MCLKLPLAERFIDWSHCAVSCVNPIESECKTALVSRILQYILQYKNDHVLIFSHSLLYMKVLLLTKLETWRGYRAIWVTLTPHSWRIQDFIMHWKLPFLICKQRCHGGGKERWTESKGAERRRVTGSLLDKDDSQGLKGGGFTAALFSVVSGLWVSLFYCPSRSSSNTHEHNQDRCMRAGDAS